MCDEQSTARTFRWAMHRLSCWNSVARRAPRVPRGAALGCAIERLEGRVVPSTIVVTNLHNSGRGSLRSAIETADLNREGADTIKFASSVRGAIALTSALPNLSTHIVISGPGPSALTVARSYAPGTPAFRIFTVAKGAKVSISGLTIANGSGAAGGGIDNAGSLALFNTTISGNSVTGGPNITPDSATAGNGDGGGIDNSGKLSVTSSTFSDNSATGGINETGGFGYGGGIANSGKLSVADSTFSGNSATGGSGHDAGSGGGGGIENSGMFSVTGCTFSGNSTVGDSTNSAGDGDGGGVMNAGKGSVADSSFSSNSASGGFGLLASSGAGNGGGIDNSGTLSVTGCTFSGNVATDTNVIIAYGYGGGLANTGTLSVANCTFSGNTAIGGFGGYGGGIANSGSLTAAGTTFSGNTAAGSASEFAGYGEGGAIENSGTASITNSTLNGNSTTSTTGTFGGGIADSGTLSLTYVTSDQNSAASGGGIGIVSGGQPAVDLIDSIFQNAQGGNIFGASGDFHSSGHNLFSDDPGISLESTDLVNTAPLLGPLADNGGPTFTQALLPGSPALDAGIAVAGVTTDQRGGSRPSTGATDIGAFEVQPPLTVVSLKRSGTGRHPTVLVLSFNLPLDAVTAESLANYRLVQAANDSAIVIRSAKYNAAAQTVTLRPKTRLSPSQTYMLTVIGTPPSGLTTVVGAYLAGAGAGQPGTNYVATLT